MKYLFSLFPWLLALLLASPARADDGGKGVLDWAKAFGKVVARRAADSMLEQTTATLKRLHPATLVRRGRTPGLALAPEWQDAPLDRPLVIVVHGFYSNRDRAERLLVDVVKAGFPIGRFEYASERPIEESAQFLAEQLRTVAEQQPERSVTLVTHSLGGIVARAVIEDPALNPGNVRQLIMIAPPNHGSALADLGYAARSSPNADEAEGRLAAELGRSVLAKCIGPASEQLQTDSLFLATLNRRPRNPAVRYTIFLGTKAPLNRKGSQLLQVAANESDRRWRWTRWTGEIARDRLALLPELQQGQGDGVVSVASGRLEGVNDTVLLDFHHNEPLWDANDEAVQQLFREVLDRL